MFSQRQFQRFLVVKIADRIQQISQEKCTGCIAKTRLDQLHPCMMKTLTERMEMFLPRAKSEAARRIGKLYNVFQQSSWVDDAHTHIQDGEYFITKLQPDDLLDRRYVNEDSVIEYPYDVSWLYDVENIESLPEAPFNLLMPVIPFLDEPTGSTLPSAPASSLKRKRTTSEKKTKSKKNKISKNPCDQQGFCEHDPICMQNN